jgi:hypothetical protein
MTYFLIPALQHGGGEQEKKLAAAANEAFGYL